MAIIGIDLGTTNSLVAQLDEFGRPQIVHNAEGDNLTPSAILFEDATNIVVGKEAKKALATQPELVAREFKRDMGTEKTFRAHDKNFTPTELSALLLTKLRKDFEAQLGSANTVVVTVPANFNNDAREATLSAIRAAGLSSDAIINEPTAAALYYAHSRGKALNGTYVVYDLGGGTFDVTAIKAKDKDIEVLATDGVTKLGGKDFDDIMTQIVAQKFEAQHRTKFEPVRYGWSQLDAEELKKSLTQLPEKRVRVVGPDIPPTTITVTRAEFEQAISTLIAQTEILCENVLGEARLTPSDIDDVFLAGGSSRIPIVAKTISTLFKRTPQVVGNPDEAIALGAAIFAGLKAAPERLNKLQREAIRDVAFQDVAPHFFGTLARDAATGRLANSVIIEKNTPIPCRRTEDFFTVTANQESVLCTITQSPHLERDPRFVKKVWEGELSLPGGRPEGQKVSVTYEYTENGTMRASFLDVASGRRQDVDIAAQSAGASPEININDFLVE